MAMKILFILLLALSLQAATPKTYSSIGDPVYQTVEPIRKFSSFITFKEDEVLFSDYVIEADKARDEGFWIDKYRLLREAKERSKKYLNSLRYLQQINRQISKIIKDTTLTAIKKHHAKTYYAIKKARHPVFRNDAELRRAAKRFETTLKRERKQRKVKQQKETKVFLRSYKNLKGSWTGVEHDGTAVEFKFTRNDTIEIIRKTPALKQSIIGLWRSDDSQMKINAKSITQQKASRVAHTRETSAVILYRIESISKKSLKLYDERRRYVLTLSR